EVDLVGRDAVAAAVARQEDQARLAERAGDVGVRRRAERRVEPDLFERRQALDFVEPGAADDSDGACRHRAIAYHTLGAMDIDTLVAQGKYAEAAAEARRRGQLDRAQRLYERIWDWRAAA